MKWFRASSISGPDPYKKKSGLGGFFCISLRWPPTPTPSGNAVCFRFFSDCASTNGLPSTKPSTAIGGHASNDMVWLLSEYPVFRYFMLADNFPDFFGVLFFSIFPKRELASPRMFYFPKERFFPVIYAVLFYFQQKRFFPVIHAVLWV